MKMAEYALKRVSKVAEDVVVSFDEKTLTQLKFSNNKVSTTQRWQSSYIGIFASIKKRTVATSVVPDKKSVDEAVDKLVDFSATASENKTFMGIAKGPFRYRPIKSFDPSVMDVDMSDYAAAAINAALDNGAKRTAGVLEFSSGNTSLLSTGNVDCGEEFSRAYFSIRSLCDGDGSGHDVSACRRLKDLKHVEAAESSARIAKQSMNPSSIKEGKYDLFLEHLPAANLFENAASSASIFNVESGLSFFGGMMGKQVASPLFTLVDDAAVDWGIGSRRFDDEGVPTTRTTIVEKGVLRNFLHNTSTAILHKTKTTASAGLVSPRALNPVVEKGNLNKDEMVSKIRLGLLVTNVWYTRFQNYTTGDFSTIPRDGLFLVENGKIVKPVKGVRISDNLLGMLKRITGVSSDSRPVMSWELENPITTPQFLVKDISITRSVE